MGLLERERFSQSGMDDARAFLDVPQIEPDNERDDGGSNLVGRTPNQGKNSRPLSDLLTPRRIAVTHGHSTAS